MNPSTNQVSMQEYASDNTEYKQSPDENQTRAGVVPLDTLPAAWWNWLWSTVTKNNNASLLSIADLRTEMLAILTNAGITPDVAKTNQLLNAIITIIRRAPTFEATGDAVPGTVISSSDVTSISVDSTTGKMLVNALSDWTASDGETVKEYIITVKDWVNARIGNVYETISDLSDDLNELRDRLFSDYELDDRYKQLQDPVPASALPGTSVEGLAFIEDITQDEQGKITKVKRSRVRAGNSGDNEPSDFDDSEASFGYNKQDASGHHHAVTLPFASATPGIMAGADAYASFDGIYDNSIHHSEMDDMLSTGLFVVLPATDTYPVDSQLTLNIEFDAITIPTSDYDPMLNTALFMDHVQITVAILACTDDSNFSTQIVRTTLRAYSEATSAGRLLARSVKYRILSNWGDFGNFELCIYPAMAEDTGPVDMYFQSPARVTVISNGRQRPVARPHYCYGCPGYYDEDDELVEPSYNGDVFFEAPIEIRSYNATLAYMPTFSPNNFVTYDGYWRNVFGFAFNHIYETPCANYTDLCTLANGSTAYLWTVRARVDYSASRFPIAIMCEKISSPITFRTLEVIWTSTAGSVQLQWNATANNITNANTFNKVFPYGCILTGPRFPSPN